MKSSSSWDIKSVDVSEEHFASIFNV
jgi:hypothetical protein